MSKKKPQTEAEYQTRNREYPYLPIWPKRHGHIFVPHGDGWEPAEVALARENTARSGRLRARSSRQNEEMASKGQSVESMSSPSTEKTSPKDPTNEKNYKLIKPKNKPKSETSEDKPESECSLKKNLSESSSTAMQASDVVATPAKSTTENVVEDKGDTRVEISVIKKAIHSTDEGLEQIQQEPHVEDKKFSSEALDESTKTKSTTGGEEGLPSLSETPLISHSCSPAGGISDLISAAIAVATPEGSPSSFDKESGLPEIDDSTAEKKNVAAEHIEKGEEGSPKY